MKNSSKKEIDLQDSQYTPKPFNTWVLMDYTAFAISRLRDAELSQIGLTHEQSAILQILVRNKGRSTIHEISIAWMRQPNSVSTLINRMEKQGLVSKNRLAKQREYSIKITKKGYDLLKIVPGVIIEDVFSILSAEDIRKLTQYLTLLFIEARTLQGNSNLSFLYDNKKY
jgi:DNA-binding MarR family transcriptional regulator